MNVKRKKFLFISASLVIIGIIIILLVTYFLIQSVRESFYQNAFDKRYDFVSLQEDGMIDAVQVFHGVKLNTYVESESNPSTIILEINDEVEAKLKGHKVNPEEEGMKPYSGVIQYKVMKDKQTGKEEFIVSLDTTPVKENNSITKFRTYTINENGIVKKSNFTEDTKSKLETQWIKGISDETHGYYTDLPYQDEGRSSLFFLSLLGLLCIAGGIWLGKSILINEKGAAA
ncbi:hypothetical protein [Rossellomorea aquimaris]|uniref:hypothetical protein n=1 Tax=Rossellomorea aquimaris TaxID=189382 RepID=UPI0005CB4953|nr:hypothetical protein [Rossellomorea aquimaris]